jgi:hypothetical protein
MRLARTQCGACWWLSLDVPKISSWADLGFNALESAPLHDVYLKLCDRIWCPNAPETTSRSKRRSIRKQGSECGLLPSYQFGDHVPELRLLDILDLNTPGDHDMKYFLALFIFSSGVASSNAATLLDKVRLAQTRTFAECIANCNSSNFSCAQNCGLSGSCVAQCTAEASSCKSRCSEPK